MICVFIQKKKHKIDIILQSRDKYTQQLSVITP